MVQSILIKCLSISDINENLRSLNIIGLFGGIYSSPYLIKNFLPVLNLFIFLSLSGKIRSSDPNYYIPTLYKLLINSLSYRLRL